MNINWDTWARQGPNVPDSDGEISIRLNDRLLVNLKLHDTHKHVGIVTVRSCK